MKNNMDWLAEQACSVLEESVSKAYAEEKRGRLAGLNRFEVLVCKRLAKHIYY